jgi:hypothetical protein
MWFMTDDGFNDCPELMSIPARYRLSAEGLWHAIGVWMAKHGEYFIPLTVVKKLGGTDLLVDKLCDSGLLDRAVDNSRAGLAYTGRSCHVKAPEALQKGRAATAQRVRKYRAKQRNGADLGVEEDVTPLPVDESSCYSHARGVVRKGTESNHPPSQGQLLPKSGTALGDSDFELATSERGLSPPVNVGASRLVAAVVGIKVNDADKTILRIKASEMLADESEDDVAECLRVWLSRPELGAHGLPLCMAEVYKRRNNGRKLTSTERYAVEVDAIGKSLIAEQLRKELPQ